MSPLITVTKTNFKINLVTIIGEAVGTDPDRVSEEGVREHDGDIGEGTARHLFQ